MKKQPVWQVCVPITAQNAKIDGLRRSTSASFFFLCTQLQLIIIRAVHKMASLNLHMFLRLIKFSLSHFMWWLNRVEVSSNKLEVALSNWNEWIQQKKKVAARKRRHTDTHNSRSILPCKHDFNSLFCRRVHRVRS